MISKPIHVRIPIKFYNKLKAAAEARGRKVSTHIREIIFNAFDGETTTNRKARAK